MDKSANNVVIGNPILGSANGNYGKHISGVTQVSTQSGSYNMETIHIFVTYGHTTITLKPNVDVSLAYKKVDGIITFEPRVTQSMDTILTKNSPIPLTPSNPKWRKLEVMPNSPKPN